MFIVLFSSPLIARVFALPQIMHNNALTQKAQLIFYSDRAVEWFKFGDLRREALICDDPQRLLSYEQWEKAIGPGLPPSEICDLLRAD